MAVLEAERGEGKFEVLTCAWNLCVYTLNTCKSEKNFPKRDRWILAKPIVEECLNAIRCIRKANAVQVTSEADYAYRHEQQAEAYGCLESLLTLIELACKANGIESRVIEFWTGLAMAAEEKLKAWTKRDRERYKNFIKGDSAS